MLNHVLTVNLASFLHMNYKSIASMYIHIHTHTHLSTYLYMHLFVIHLDEKEYAIYTILGGVNF